MNKVIVVGAGMAGSEAAWQVAQRGIPVELYEMRPVKSTPAHKTDLFAELVCSNSLRGAGLENAVGVLKEEMRRLGSIIMEAADATKVPAGGALAVDRLGFSRYITDRVKNHPLIKVKLKVIMAKRLVIHIIKWRLHHQPCIPNKVLCQFLVCIVCDQKILPTQKGMCRTIHLNAPCRYCFYLLNAYNLPVFMSIVFWQVNWAMFN